MMPRAHMVSRWTERKVRDGKPVDTARWEEAKCWIDRQLGWIKALAIVRFRAKWREHLGLCYEAAVRLAYDHDPSRDGGGEAHRRQYVARWVCRRVSDLGYRAMTPVAGGARMGPKLLGAAAHALLEEADRSVEAKDLIEFLRRRMRREAADILFDAYVDGLSLRELAERHCMSIQTVKNRMFAARAKAREALAEAA